MVNQRDNGSTHCHLRSNLHAQPMAAVASAHSASFPPQHKLNPVRQRGCGWCSPWITAFVAPRSVRWPGLKRFQATRGISSTCTDLLHSTTISPYSFKVDQHAVDSWPLLPPAAVHASAQLVVKSAHAHSDVATATTSACSAPAAWQRTIIMICSRSEGTVSQWPWPARDAGGASGQGSW
eukprot:jgi/Ulvmu1/14/UM001_0015.1